MPKHWHVTKTYHCNILLEHCLEAPADGNAGYDESGTNINCKECDIYKDWKVTQNKGGDAK